jgi:hypothetical protein
VSGREPVNAGLLYVALVSVVVVVGLAVLGFWGLGKLVGAW